jgi:hypothetical protein
VSGGASPGGHADPRGGGGLQENARATEQEHTGHAEALVDEGHRALRTRLGKGLRHKGLRLVSTSQLCQDNLVGNLRRCC